MTEEARKIVKALRNNIRDGFYWIGNAEFSMPCTGMINLIESLSEQLEQVTMERDGLNIMLSQALAMLETRTRERDAAIRDFTEAMKYSENCMFCKYLSGTDDEIDCNKPKIMPCENCWQWRGVEVNNDAQKGSDAKS